MEAAVRANLDAHRRWLHPRHDSIETLQIICGRGYRLGLMSGSPTDVRAIWHETPFCGMFDVELLSCEIDLMKPDPEFYQLACERLQVRPEDCLYVGDAGEELFGARDAGMLAVHMCPDAERDRIMQHQLSRDWDGLRIRAIREVLDVRWIV